MHWIRSPILFSEIQIWQTVPMSTILPMTYECKEEGNLFKVYWNYNVWKSLMPERVLAMNMLKEKKNNRKINYRRHWKLWQIIQKAIWQTWQMTAVKFFITYLLTYGWPCKFILALSINKFLMREYVETFHSFFINSLIEYSGQRLQISVAQVSQYNNIHISATVIWCVSQLTIRNWS